MMNVHSIGCQPLKPSYQLNSKPTFGNWDEMDYAEADLSSLRRERLEMEELAKNKDSKLISSIGTLGVGVAAGALSFVTFKTMAPKGWAMLKTMYNKVAGFEFVKKSANYVREKSVKLGAKISDWYNNIAPETKLGKVKTFITDKLAWVKTKTSPITSKISEKYKAFIEKHNITKGTLKEAAKNTGATLTAIPAAITAVNSNIEGGEE